MFIDRLLPGLFAHSAKPYDNRTLVGKALNRIDRSFLENTKQNPRGILYMMKVHNYDEATAEGVFSMAIPNEASRDVPFTAFVFEKALTIKVTDDQRGDTFVFPRGDASHVMDLLIRVTRPHGFEFNIMEREPLVA